MLKYSAAFKVNGTILLFDKKSLFLFRGDSSFRQKIVQLIHHKVFEWVVFIFIVINSISVASFDYSDKESITMRNQVIDAMDDFFTVFFLIECLIKAIAKGLFMHKNSYLRSGWSIIDILVVTQGVVEIFSPQSPIRFLRVFRPLRSITAIAKLRNLATALVRAIPDMANVGLFLIFGISLMAILGVNQYNGMLYNRCSLPVDPKMPTVLLIDNSSQRACSKTGLGHYTCAENSICGSPADFNMTADQIQYDIESMFQISNFDNFGTAVLSVFLIFTSDKWNEFMYNLADVDTPLLAQVFCIFCRIFFMFFLLNLLLAIIIQAFIDIQKHEMIEMFQKNDRLDKNKKAYLKELNEMKKVITIIPVRKSLINYTQVSTPAQRDPFQLHKARLKYMREQLNDLNSKEDPVDQEVLRESIEHIEYIITSIKEIEGSFNDPFEALNFLRPLIKKRVFSSIFKSSLDNKNHAENEEDKVEEIFERQDNQQVIQQELNNIIEIDLNRVKNESSDSIDSDSMEQSQDGTAQEIKLNSISKQNLIKRLILSVIERAIENEIKFYQNGIATQEQLLALDKIHSHKKHLSRIIDGLKKQLDQTMLVKKRRKMLLESNVRELAAFRQASLLRSRLRRIDTSNEFHHYMVQRKKSAFYRIANIIVENAFFKALIVITISANTTVLGIDNFHSESEEKLNILFSVILFSEMVLKLIAFGKMYFTDYYNIFDFILVIVSILEVFYTQITHNSEGKFATGLRSVRILRMIKIAKHSKRFKHLILTMLRALQQVGIYSAFLFIFMFSYAILGLELFYGNAKVNEEQMADPNGIAFDGSFDNYIDSLKTVFVLLTNDNWAYIFQIHYQTTGPIQASFYFLSLIIIGQKVVLNLFLAILLESFDVDSLSQELNRHLLERKVVHKKSYFSIMVNTLKDLCTKKQKKKKVKILPEEQASIKKSESSPDTNHEGHQNKLETTVIVQKVNDLEGKSLYIFKKSSPIRKVLNKLIEHRVFGYMTNAFIFISAITLALTNPLNDPLGKQEIIIYWIDVITTIVFILEMVIKVIARGFLLCGPKSYLRDPWNILDFLTVTFSILALTPLPNKLSIVKVFRIMRPLRVISRFEGLKLQVKSLFYSIPNIINVFIIFLLFLIITSIITKSFMKGKMSYCVHEHVEKILNVEEILKTKWDCLNLGGEWRRRELNFDTIGKSMMTLFQIGVMQNWSKIMVHAISSTEEDMVPEHKASIYLSLYFIVYIILISFFLLNIFGGIVISVFNRQRDKINGSYLLNETQKEFISSRLLVLKSNPIKYKPPPKNKFRLVIYKVATSNAFERLILICIVCNSIVLVSEFYNQPLILSTIQENLNLFFTVIYLVEALIKILALGKDYFKSGWNIFDFLVVAFSFIGIALTELTPVNLGGKINIIRALRICRILRLIKRARRLNLVFNTLISTLPWNGPHRLSSLPANLHLLSDRHSALLYCDEVQLNLRTSQLCIVQSGFHYLDFSWNWRYWANSDA